jgi:hypothetical protein
MDLVLQDYSPVISMGIEPITFRIISAGEPIQITRRIGSSITENRTLATPEKAILTVELTKRSRRGFVRNTDPE